MPTARICLAAFWIFMWNCGTLRLGESPWAEAIAFFQGIIWKGAASRRPDRVTGIVVNESPHAGRAPGCTACWAWSASSYRSDRATGDPWNARRYACTAWKRFSPRCGGMNPFWRQTDRACYAMNSLQGMLPHPLEAICPFPRTKPTVTRSVQAACGVLRKANADHAASAARVSGPTTPSADNPLSRWKRSTASRVPRP